MPDLDKLDKAINELEKQSNDLKEFNAVFAEITQLKRDIQKNFKLLQEGNQALTEISKELETRLTDFEKRVDELFRVTKAFQQELDSSLASRLEKHKSDLQVEIRNEGTEIERVFETRLTYHFNQIESKLKESYERQTGKFNILITMVSILIALAAVWVSKRLGII